MSQTQPRNGRTAEKLRNNKDEHTEAEEEWPERGHYLSLLSLQPASMAPLLNNCHDYHQEFQQLKLEARSRETCTMFQKT